MIYGFLTFMHFLSADTKGQLILKCVFGIFKSPKQPTTFLRISALASKERSNQ